MPALPLDWLAEIVAPSRCAACAERTGLGRAFCVPCARSVERAPQEPSSLAFAVYGGAVSRAVARFKYEGDVGAGRILGRLLAQAAGGAPALDGATCVVPVPLHPNRLAERGFNQATLLARPLARAVGAQLAPCALVRTRDTRRQVGLARSVRAQNVAGAFAVRESSRVRGRTVVLVDDVLTSGATLAACAEALLGSGARRVVVAVVARAGTLHDTAQIAR